MKQLLLPAKMRDLIKEEVQVKRQLQSRLQSLFSHWGYEEVMTPTMEYYETYVRGFEDIHEEQMYKFVDHSGRIVALKADMTIPIARLAATKFKGNTQPLRFQYCDKVFKVNEVLSGLYDEMSDCGIELIGADETYDVEVLAMALDTLEVLHQKHMVFEIGNIKVFNEACTCAGVFEQDKKRLAYLIGQKHLPELRIFLNRLNLSEEQKNFFEKLVWLSGSLEVFEDALQYAFADELKKEIRKTQKLCETLYHLGYTKFDIDLGKINNLNYYTGIMFEAYIEGVGVRVLNGGRYDNLLQKFDSKASAIGFSVKLDALIQSVEVCDCTTKITIQYPSEKVKEALALRKQYSHDVMVSLCINNDLEEVVVKEEETCYPSH